MVLRACLYPADYHGTYDNPVPTISSVHEVSRTLRQGRPCRPDCAEAFRPGSAVSWPDALRAGALTRRAAGRYAVFWTATFFLLCAGCLLSGAGVITEDFS